MLKRANFLYFLGTKDNQTEIFVYGLSIPTMSKEAYSLNIEKIKNVGTKFLYRFRAVTEIDDDCIKDQSINLNLFSDKIVNRHLNYFYKRKYLQGSDPCKLEKMMPSPILSCCEIDCYFSDEFLLANLPDSDVLEILKLLKQTSNVPFYGIYFNRLGCFDFAYAYEWSEKEPPFQIKVKKNKLYFYKDKSISSDVILSLKMLASSTEKSLDKLFFIESDDEWTEILHDYDDDIGYEYSVYTKDGKLLHNENIVWINNKGFTLTTVIENKKVILNDNYSKKDSNANIVVLKSISKSTTFSPNVNHKLINFNKYMENVSNLISHDKKNEFAGQWFSKSKNHTISDVINYLNRIISYCNAKEIIIIDPYLDEDIINLCARINCSIDISVISSKKCILEDSLDKVRRSKEIIENLGLPASKLKYFILSRKFHDRFIMLKNSSNKIYLYCLPNSVNAILKKNDFLFIRLEGKLFLEGVAYVNSLMAECKTSSLLENMYEQ